MESKEMITKLAQRKGLKAKAKEYMLTAARVTRALAQFIKDKGSYNTDFLIDAAVDSQIALDQIRAYDPNFFDLLYEQRIKEIVHNKYILDKDRRRSI